jgi:hypothetical protein
MLQFDSSSHRYRNLETGRFVQRDEVLRLVDEETSRLEVRLKGHARLLVSGKIEISEFQTRMAQSLKESHIRMAALGGGGLKQMTPQQYGHVGQQLKKQYQFLYKFGRDLEENKSSSVQIIRRAGMYAQSTKTSFHQAEFTARGRVGFYAKRLLDAQARHCPECINYQQLQWRLISQIVPPGVNCTCGGRCRCRIVFRKI